MEFSKETVELFEKLDRVGWDLAHNPKLAGEEFKRAIDERRKEIIEGALAAKKNLAGGSEAERESVAFPPVMRSLPSKEEFVRRSCEMMEIDKSSSLTYAGVVDLLENVFESFSVRERGNDA